MNQKETLAEKPRRPRMSPASAAYRLTKQYSDGVKAASTIEPKTQELVKVRASQINGCAFCLDMHAREALELGEDPRRLYTVSAWRDTEFFTGAERAALELTEAVTRISEAGVPDEVYARVRGHYSEEQYLDLLLLIGVINVWNRLSVALHSTPPAITR
ncbi:MAG TPA: carboxymuconolactone decarboxylase family protein [Armatimonadaceae bacterium]|nr:carboxymuconolactone decarboxylase family protein [Armatimonadaceae bacterium]